MYLESKEREKITKICTSREQKEFFRLNKKHFSKFLKPQVILCCYFALLAFTSGDIFFHNFSEVHTTFYMIFVTNFPL